MYSVNLGHIVSDYNAKLHERDDFGNPGEHESLDGIVVRHHSRFHIGINSKLSEYEKAYVTMHEIGHIATGTVGVIGSLICERMCDDFAVDALIPDDRLREAIEFYGEDWEHFDKLFGVSHDTMLKKSGKINI